MIAIAAIQVILLVAAIVIVVRVLLRAIRRYLSHTLFEGVVRDIGAVVCAIAIATTSLSLYAAQGLVALDVQIALHAMSSEGHPLKLTHLRMRDTLTAASFSCKTDQSGNCVAFGSVPMRNFHSLFFIWWKVDFSHASIAATTEQGNEISGEVINYEVTEYAGATPSRVELVTKFTEPN